MSKDELLDIDEAGSWEPKGNESRGKIRKYKCDCIRTKKECDYCGGTGIVKACYKLTVHTINFNIDLRSNYSPIYGNVRCPAKGFYLEEEFVYWNHGIECWVKFEYDDDFFIDDDKPLFITGEDLGDNTDCFTFDGADIIRLFKLKGYDFDDKDDYWWQRDYFDQQGGSYHHKETDYIDTHNFNSSLLKFNFEKEDTYETSMKKWESFKRSFKKVSSVDHFCPSKWDDNEKKFKPI